MTNGISGDEFHHLSAVALIGVFKPLLFIMLAAEYFNFMVTVDNLAAHMTDITHGFLDVFTDAAETMTDTVDNNGSEWCGDK